MPNGIGETKNGGNSTDGGVGRPVIMAVVVALAAFGGAYVGAQQGSDNDEDSEAQVQEP